MKAHAVVLSYPVAETIEGLGEVHTTRCERTYHDSASDAFDAYKVACRRLDSLGEGAQVDLLAHGVVIGSQANLPDGPLDHPIVAELERKLRNEGRLR